MVAVTGAPGTRGDPAGGAMAARIKAPLVAVHVVSGDADTRESGTDELEELVRAVGGRWQTLNGDDVAKTIFAAAVDQQITQIVLGTSRLTRWQSLTRGSVIQQLLRMASETTLTSTSSPGVTKPSGRAGRGETTARDASSPDGPDRRRRRGGRVAAEPACSD